MCACTCCECVQMTEQFNHQSLCFSEMTFCPYNALSLGWRGPGSLPLEGVEQSRGHVGTLRKDVRCPWGRGCMCALARDPG